MVKKIEEMNPMIHCITNYVTANDVANCILAIGGRPMMADDPHESDVITSLAKGLVINMGTLNDRKIEAMIKSGKKANELHIPVILDPVGVGASEYRKETLKKLLDNIHFDVIRGNISELKVILDYHNQTSGVDVLPEDEVNDNNLNNYINITKKIAIKMNSIIVMSGAIDIVTSSEKTIIVKNGCEKMASITGTGCMLTGVVATFMANSLNIYNIAYAVSMFGLCGEKAYSKMIKENSGTGSMHMYLIDYLGNMTENELMEGMIIDER